MISDPNRLSDGFISLERGVDGGSNPSLLHTSQAAHAENATFRRGFIATRPGFKKVPLKASSEATQMLTGKFQGADYYEDSEGVGHLMVMAGGSLFRVSFTGSVGSVVNVSIAGDLNPASMAAVYMVQAEQYLIVQDGLSRPLIYDGAVTRRANSTEVPTGSGPMAYGMGRLWVAQGRDYIAGDIVGGPTGVLKFTENDYLAEGGSFSVPLHSGEITGMRFTAALNTAMGQGELLIFTPDAVYSTVVPADRDTWKLLTDPIQRIALINYGALSHHSTELVNGDVFFRARDGIRSLVMAIREFGSPGTTPISREMGRVLNYDTAGLLSFTSASLFNNRLLLTATPSRRTDGAVAFAGLVVLDFDLLSSMGQKAPAAYDGFWNLTVTRSGVTKPLQFLRLLKGRFNGVERCFTLACDGNSAMELWELTTDGRFDVDVDANGATTDNRIKSVVETKSYNFQSATEAKLLETAEMWVDRVAGVVDFDLDYRPDQYPCWVDWYAWQIAGDYRDCGPSSDCQPKTFLEQYRPRMRVPQPLDTIEPVANKPFRLGWEFQARLSWTGHARIRMLRLNTYRTQEEPFADIPLSEASKPLTCPC